MNIQLLRYKELVIKTIREYFYTRGFHEVFIPLLHPSVPLEPNIYPFTTMWNTTHNVQLLYLSTSPESALKQYVAGGGGNCFAIAPAFRNFEDISPIHTAEFLMLEWYQLNATYKDSMKETQLLITHVGKHVFNNTPVSFGSSWPQHTMANLFQKHVGVSLCDLIDYKKMIARTKTKGYTIKSASWEQLFNQLFLNEVEPKLGHEPCFITDYPSRISPLCKPKENEPDFAERFELYIRGMEIANGNTENTDADGIKKVFAKESQWRKTHGMIASPINESFLGALKKLKTKRISGVGLGVDRLVMVLSGIKDIHEFEPTMRV